MGCKGVPSSVTALFQQLADQHGFRVRPPRRTGAFEGLMQWAEGEHVSLVFVRDRGEEYIQVWDGQRSWPPYLVQLVLTGAEVEDAPEDLERDVSFLAGHIAEVERLFHPEHQAETIARLKALGKKLRPFRFPPELFPEFFMDGD